MEGSSLKPSSSGDESARPSLGMFDDLAEQRAVLREFCTAHVQSIEHFTAKNFPILFKVTYEREPEQFRHITSTATCYESLSTCPERFRSRKTKFQENGAAFAAQAIARDQDEWKSDDSAYIYCRCRGLPYVLSRLTPTQQRTFRRSIAQHLERIFAQLEKDTARFAIGEADPLGPQGVEIEDWYPPNAYHTFWTLEVIDACGPLLRSDLTGLGKRLNIPHRELQMKDWAKQALAYQISLHSAKSSALDSDQLAWALAIFLRNPTSYLSRLAEQDFIREAFSCLFSTQTKVGTWPRYAPLFHYRRSGNAYCYVFETFATVLRQALRPEAEFVRNVLREHYGRLVLLWEYARTTLSPLDRGSKRFGWSSGHRANQPIESWATASVFAYAQSLRRLLGIWTREESLTSLNRPHSVSNRKQSIKKLDERSDIWSLDGPELKDQLWSMFVNQVCTVKSDDRTEPDRQPIGEHCPRSAILFGPPGTSKTTLVKALAGCIQWEYVELHASHFVADGLPNVQKTADRIFRFLSELDHAVVLFDEIDELVRAREIEKDAFGRFLTTSMLPKLAELWEARKIMYFVATNHIEFFDSAITRSQRFDAVLFISPPSFDAKVRELTRTLKEQHGITVPPRVEVERGDIEKSLAAFKCLTQDQPVPPEGLLAKFALLRFDELGELAINLTKGARRGEAITKDVLTEALSLIKDDRRRGVDEYLTYLREPSFERLDVTKEHIWRIKGMPTSLLSCYIKERGGRPALVARVKSLADIEIPEHTITKLSHGRVRILSLDESRTETKTRLRIRKTKRKRSPAASRRAKQ